VLRSARSHVRLATAAKEAAALDASASASATWTAALKETRALSAASRPRFAEALAKEASALDASASASATWTAAFKASPRPWPPSGPPVASRALAEASRPCLAEALATKWAGGSELGGSGPTGALASCVAKSDSIFEANACQATAAQKTLRSASSHIRLATAAKEAAALDASASASATWTAALKETRALSAASRPRFAEALASKWAGGSELGGSGPTGLRDDIMFADEVGGEQVT
jgi:hypothetical protein